MIPSQDAKRLPSGEIRASNGPTAPIAAGLRVSSESSGGPSEEPSRPNLWNRDPRTARIVPSSAWEGEP